METETQRSEVWPADIPRETNTFNTYNIQYIQIKEDIIVNIEVKIEEKEINNIIKNEELPKSLIKFLRLLRE